LSFLFNIQWVICIHTYTHVLVHHFFSPILSKTHMVDPFLNVLPVNNTIIESFGVVDIVVLNMNMCESFIPSSTNIWQVFNPWQSSIFFSCLHSQLKQSTCPHRSPFNLKTGQFVYYNGRKRVMICQPSVFLDYVFSDDFVRNRPIVRLYYKLIHNIEICFLWCCIVLNFSLI